jgi:hypothetical protein
VRGATESNDCFHVLGQTPDDLSKDALDSALVRVLKNDTVVQDAHGVGIIRMSERDAARSLAPPIDI